MKLEWTKHKAGWMGIYGSYRAEISRSNPDAPFQYWCWGIWKSGKPGSSGSAHTIPQAKRLAERFVNEWTEKSL